MAKKRMSPKERGEHESKMHESREAKQMMEQKEEFKKGEKRDLEVHGAINKMLKRMKGKRAK